MLRGKPLIIFILLSMLPLAQIRGSDTSDKVDLEAQSLMAVPMVPVTGENVTIAFMYTNKGNSPFSGVQIGFYVDNALIEMLNDTRVIEPSGSLIASAIWMATSGNHMISVKLDPLNMIHETNEDNNELSITIVAKLARLTIKAMEGVNITVDGNVTRVGSSREVVFYANLNEEIQIVAQKTNYFADTKYVFQRWKLDDVWINNSMITLFISGDTEIEAIYKAEYMVRISFLDSKGHQISAPSTVRFIAPNGSSIVLRGGYDVWLPQGTMTITSINWSDANVMPSDSNYNIVGPMTLSINCKVFDVTVAVGDSLDIPVAGANVMLVLPNGTTVSRVTALDGKAIFLRIPTGRLGGTVSNLGIITTIAGRELTSDLTLNLTVVLSSNTIMFVTAVAVIVVSGLFIWRVSAKRKQRLPPPPPPPPSSMVDQEQPPPPPPLPSEQGKYRSQFQCRACGRSFWVYEHRFKVPYCQECGAPDPVHIITVEHEGE